MIPGEGIHARGARIFPSLHWSREVLRVKGTLVLSRYGEYRTGLSKSAPENIYVKTCPGSSPPQQGHFVQSSAPELLIQEIDERISKVQLGHDYVLGNQHLAV